MKNKLSFLAAIVVSVTSLWANPSEINYQGVLTDQQGNPINGVRAMQIKIYDAPTGGTLLYSEDLGNVSVQDGVYSFKFGANGTSNAPTTETVAIANGTVSTFQKVLAAPTVVAGSVTVTDGTYTWDQTNGSSNENDFSVAYSSNLRRITVTYYNGAPAAGKNITAKFRAPNAGILGALAGDTRIYSETIISGAVQNPRQEILTVPFASFSRNTIDEKKVSLTDLEFLTKAVVHSCGVSSKVITGRVNSTRDLLGIVADGATLSLPSGGALINTVSVYVNQTPSYETSRDGNIKYNYYDGTNSVVTWNNSTNRTTPATFYCPNPFPSKKVSSIVQWGQEWWTIAGYYISYSSAPLTAFTDQMASLTFEQNNIAASKVFVSPQADASQLNSPQIRVILSNSESVWGGWNEWIALPSGSKISKIEVSGKLKQSVSLSIPAINTLYSPP